MESQPPNLPDFPREPMPPDLLEWARQTLDVEDFMTDLREIERTGGVKFEDFIGELEESVRPK